MTHLCGLVCFINRVWEICLRDVMRTMLKGQGLPSGTSWLAVVVGGGGGSSINI